VHKRRGKHARKSYVTMELDQFIPLLLAYDKVRKEEKSND